MPLLTYLPADSRLNMVELPPEIWLHVLKHLPDTVASELYSLNRVCFDYAMDIKYGKLVVRLSCKAKWSRDPVVRLPFGVLVGLRHQHARNRVRSVTLLGASWHKWDEEQMKGMKQYARTIASQPKDWLVSVLNRRKYVFTQASQESVERLSTLPRLEVLQIDDWWHGLRHNLFSLSLVGKILSNAASTLTVLPISLVPKDFAHILETHFSNRDAPCFPSLTHLRLYFRHTWISDPPSSDIFAALAQNVPNLKTLELFLDWYPGDIPMVPFLRPFQLPGRISLTELRIVARFPQMRFDPESLRFLDRKSVV